MALKTFKVVWRHGFETTVTAAAVEVDRPHYRFMDEAGRETAAYTDPNIISCEETEGASHE